MLASSLLILFSSRSLARAFRKSAMNWTRPRILAVLLLDRPRKPPVTADILWMERGGGLWRLQESRVGRLVSTDVGAAVNRRGQSRALLRSYPLLHTRRAWESQGRQSWTGTGDVCPAEPAVALWFSLVVVGGALGDGRLAVRSCRSELGVLEDWSAGWLATGLVLQKCAPGARWLSITARDVVEGPKSGVTMCHCPRRPHLESRGWILRLSSLATRGPGVGARAHSTVQTLERGAPTGALGGVV